MNTKVITLLTAICFYSSTAFCSSQEDLAYLENQLQSLHTNFDQNDTSDLAHEIACNNINLLENYVIKALNRNLAKLEKYKAQLKQTETSQYSDNSESDVEYHYRNPRLSKKIEATQMKIKAIKEVLFGIQVLKLRMAT